MKKVAAVTLAITFAATAARASPPPPPPEYVYNASKVLCGPISKERVAGFSSLFAPDVMAYRNGEVIAKGRDAWLAFAREKLATAQRQVIGYSESSAGYSKGGGELLVVDVIDTVDRSNLPPLFIADPRLTTRAFLYQFGTDGLIHTVRISTAGGFWIKAH